MKTPKKFLAQVSLSLLFLLTSSTFILFAKAKVTSYLEQMQAYTAQVYEIGNTATTPEGMEQLQGLIESIGPAIQKAAYFTYLFVPLVLFILWTALIGTSFYLSQKKPRKYKHYILKFSIVSLLPFAASSYLAIKMLQTGGMFFLSGAGIKALGIYAALFLIISYFTFVAYSLLGKYNLRKLPLKSLMASVKKIYLFLPLFLLLILVAIALLSITFSTYLSLLSPEPSTAYNILGMLVALAALILLKNSMVELIIKNSRSP